MIHQNMARWITASCAQFVADNKGSFNLFCEGEPRNTASLNSWAEFRLDGPYIQEISRDCFRIDVEINIVISVVDLQQDAYTIQRMTGWFQSKLMSNIPVYRHPGVTNDVADDSSLVGCLQLRDEMKQAIVISNFGKVRPDTELYQASVEAHYRMIFDT